MDTTQEFHLKEYVKIICRRKRIILYFFLITVAFVAVLTLRQKPLYNAKTSILIEWAEEKSIVPAREWFVQKESRLIETQAEILKSKPLINKVIEMLKLVKNPKDTKSKPFRDKAKLLEKRIKVIPARQADIINIVVTYESPELAAGIANKLAKLYIYYYFGAKKTRTSRTVNFLKEQVALAKKHLERSDEKLRRYKEKRNITNLDEETILSLNRIKELENLLNTTLASYTERDIRVRNAKEELRGLREKIGEIPEEELVLARLERSVKVNEDTYLILKKKLEEARVEDALSKSRIADIRNIRIIEPAYPPMSPSQPKVLINLMLSVFVGIMGGIAFAFFVDYNDHSLWDKEDAERYLKLPVIGAIPKVTNVRKAIEEGASSAEHFRYLRNKLEILLKNQHFKTVMVANSLPGEGASTTVFALAHTMSAVNDKKILVVDANLRNPSLSKMLSLDKSPGITEVLSGKLSVEKVIQKSPHKNLYFIASGADAPNMSDLISSAEMANIVKKLESRFDLVIFDSSPIVPYGDGALLASYVDKILFIVKSGATRREVAIHALSNFKEAKSKFLGILLNCKEYFIPEGLYKAL